MPPLPPSRHPSCPSRRLPLSFPTSGPAVMPDICPLSCPTPAPCHSRQPLSGIHPQGEQRKDAGCPIPTVGHDRRRCRPSRLPATRPCPSRRQALLSCPTFAPCPSRHPPPVIPDILYRESIFRGNREKTLDARYQPSGMTEGDAAPPAFPPPAPVILAIIPILRRPRETRPYSPCSLSPCRRRTGKRVRHI